jgi:hypothetical protein
MIIDDSNEANGEISILEEEVSRSYKFPMLQYIFDKYTEKGTKETTQNHTFTFQDLVEAFKCMSN